MKQKHVICWRLNHQHNRSFSKVQTCHMLTAQPSTYDIFALIELYGRKLQSVINSPQLLSYLIGCFWSSWSFHQIIWPFFKATKKVQIWFVSMIQSQKGVLVYILQIYTSHHHLLSVIKVLVLNFITDFCFARFTKKYIGRENCY